MHHREKYRISGHLKENFILGVIKKNPTHRISHIHPRKLHRGSLKLRNRERKTKEGLEMKLLCGVWSKINLLLHTPCKEPLQFHPDF